jgi:molybdopterin-binding protein
MPTSVRNRLGSSIEGIQLGDITAQLAVRVGENPIESVITCRSADELKHKQGAGC